VCINVVCATSNACRSDRQTDGRRRRARTSRRPRPRRKAEERRGWRQNLALRRIPSFQHPPFFIMPVAFDGGGLPLGRPEPGREGCARASRRPPLVRRRRGDFGKPATSTGTSQLLKGGTRATQRGFPAGRCAAKGEDGEEDNAEKISRADSQRNDEKGTQCLGISRLERLRLEREVRGKSSNGLRAGLRRLQRGKPEGKDLFRGTREVEERKFLPFRDFPRCSNANEMSSSLD